MKIEHIFIYGMIHIKFFIYKIQIFKQNKLSTNNLSLPEIPDDKSKFKTSFSDIYVTFSNRV